MFTYSNINKFSNTHDATSHEILMNLMFRMIFFKSYEFHKHSIERKLIIKKVIYFIIINIMKFYISLIANLIFNTNQNLPSC
jgi:hypothetical protein